MPPDREPSAATRLRRCRGTQRAGLNRALSESFEAVLLDVMLPGLSGFDVLRELRKESQVPVLMLTALGEKAHRIVGLEMGADDYLPKTFSTRELLARLRAVLRRSALTGGSRHLIAPLTFTFPPSGGSWAMTLDIRNSSKQYAAQDTEC